MSGLSPSVAIALALCGCVPLAPHLIDPLAHPRFVPARYVTGVGQGSTRVIAEQRARDAVARAVQSTIESEVRVLEREHQTAEGYLAESHVWQTISERSKFAYAHLIQLDSSSHGEESGEHHAFAYMSRADAGHELVRSQEPLLHGMAASWCRALTAGGDLRPVGSSGPGGCEPQEQAQANPEEVAVATTEFRRVYGEWLALEAQLRAMKVSHEDSDRPGRWSATLAELAARVRQQVIWTVAVAGAAAEEPVALAVASRVRDALASMGVRTVVSTGATACVEGSDSPGRFRYGIEVRPRFVVAFGSLGWKATLSLPSVALRCPTGEPLFRVDIAGKGVTAINPGNEEKARQAVVGKLGSLPISQALRGKVATVVPLL